MASLRKRGRYWYVRLPAGRDPVTGRYKEREVNTHCTSEREARRVAARLAAEAEGGLVPVAHRVTVGQYLEQWLAQVVRPNLAPSTVRSYAAEVRLHIAPVLGTLPLRELRPEHLARLYADKAAEGMAPAHVHYLHRILHRALQIALQWGWIARNPAGAVTPPRLRPVERPVLSLEQARELLDHLRGDRLWSLYLVALEIGVREGELVARRWADVDWQARMLRVETKLQRLPHQGLVEGPTKHRRPRMSVSFSAVVADALRLRRRQYLAERETAGSAWSGGDWIWCWEDGRPYAPEVISRHFFRLRAQLGLPEGMHFHDLRHTSATLALARGEPLRVTQERLGHRDPATTLRMYAHATPDIHERYAEMRGELLSPSGRREAAKGDGRDGSFGAP